MDVKRDSESIQKYVTDESGIFHAEDVKAVYYPETEQDLINILKEANEKRERVTVSGAGTGLTGSRVAIHGGVIASMEYLTKAAPRSEPGLEQICHVDALGQENTIYVDKDNKEAFIPAGVTLATLADMLPAGLFYPPDPTELTAQVGGTVATNASGAMSFHHKPTREWVLGLQIVLPDGDTLTVNRGENFANGSELKFTSDTGKEYSFKIPQYSMPDTKNAAGVYSRDGMDLIDLFIGSEGLFGVISEVHVKLEETPKNLFSGIAFFNSIDDSLNYVNDLRTVKEERGLNVLSIEYFDDKALEFMRGHQVVGDDYKAAVFIEADFDLDSESGETLLELLDKNNSPGDWYARNKIDRGEQKAFRHILPEGVNSYLRTHGSYKLGTDFVVPADKFPEMFEYYRVIGGEFTEKFPRAGAHYVIFGHIGDYHLHFNFITNNHGELEYAKELYVKLARKAVELSGTVSGEHGVGKKIVNADDMEVPYLHLMYGEEGLREIARVKKVFDPNDVLNIGNIVPEEYLN